MTGPNPDPNVTRIVIRSEDLSSDTVDSSPPVQGGPARSLPGLGPAPSAVPVELPSSAAQGSGVLVALSANSVRSGLVAGGIGGLLGFFIAENLKNPAHMSASSQAALRTQTGIWVLLFGLGLGAVIGAWEGITSGAPQKACRDGGLGALAGMVAGFVGGYISQWIYSGLISHLVDQSSSSGQADGDLLLARTLGWAVLGALAGTGLALPGRSGKRVVNGLIGGGLGGAVGGFIFQLIDSSSTSTDGFGPRLIGLTLTGIGIGLGVGLVERVRRDSWLKVTGGPMAGKELILYKAETRIGRDHRNDLVLAKDPAVEPFNAAFVRDPAGAVSVLAGPGTSVLVNGQPTARARLKPGDVVGVGRTQLTYQERAAAAAPNPVGGRPPWPASM